MKKPDWQVKFKTLPEIPTFKRWNNLSHLTDEQQVSFKLLQGHQLSKLEEFGFKSILNFYKELDESLKMLDFQSFDEIDFKNFKNYFDYAFNYTPLLSNKLTVYSTYRLVINESVTSKNERLHNVRSLKYPSLELVKTINKFNRANTPATNILYTAENIDTALKEIKPAIGKLVTVGMWKPKENKEIISFPISHSDQAYKLNEGVKKANKAFETDLYNSSLLREWSTNYFKLLGREFTKNVSHHYEYVISSMLSERILNIRNDPNPSFNYDCIIYPSVGNNFGTDNLAIHPSSVDAKFQLEKIIEFEIEETYYDKQYLRSHPESITLAKVKNVKYAKHVMTNGDIIW